MKITAVKVINVKNDVAEIRKHGEDDYSIYFRGADFSVRGTWADIEEEISLANEEVSA